MPPPGWSLCLLPTPCGAGCREFRFPVTASASSSSSNPCNRSLSMVSCSAFWLFFSPPRRPKRRHNSRTDRKSVQKEKSKMLRLMFILSVCGIMLSFAGVRQQNAEQQRLFPSSASGSSYVNGCTLPVCQFSSGCGEIPSDLGSIKGSKQVFPKSGRKRCDSVGTYCPTYTHQECQFTKIWDYDTGCPDNPRPSSVKTEYTNIACQ